MAWFKVDVIKDGQVILADADCRWEPITHVGLRQGFILQPGEDLPMDGAFKMLVKATGERYGITAEMGVGGSKITAYPP